MRDLTLTKTERAILHHLESQPGSRCEFSALRNARPKGITPAGWSRVMNRLGERSMVGRDYTAIYLTFNGARALMRAGA